MPVPLLFVAGLAILWLLLVGQVDRGQVTLGVVVGILFVLVTGAGRGRGVPIRQLPRRLGYLSYFLLFLLPYQVMRSNFAVAASILRPTVKLRSGIIRLPLGQQVSRTTVALEEHALTLTPGAVVVDYSADEHTAYVHVMDVPSARRDRDGLWRTYRIILDEVFT
jgi:multisubunit Na+/H+ antiporter MnhE subunit